MQVCFICSTPSARLMAAQMASLISMTSSVRSTALPATGIASGLARCMRQLDRFWIQTSKWFLHGARPSIPERACHFQDACHAQRLQPGFTRCGQWYKDVVFQAHRDSGASMTALRHRASKFPPSPCVGRRTGQVVHTVQPSAVSVIASSAGAHSIERWRLCDRMRGADWHIQGWIPGGTHSTYPHACRAYVRTRWERNATLTTGPPQYQ